MTESPRYTPLPVFVTAPLEVLLNQWTAQAPAADLARLAGKAIAIQIRPPNLRLVLLGAADRLQVLGDWDEQEPVDVSLTGTPVGLAAALRGDRSQVMIAGDAALLGDWQHLLNASGIDWTAWLERLSGAGMTAPVQQAWTTLKDQGARLTQRNLEDLGDYLHYESDWLPARPEFAAWATDIAELRDAIARAEARVQRLEVPPAHPAPTQQPE